MQVVRTPTKKIMTIEYHNKDYGTVYHMVSDGSFLPDNSVLPRTKIAKIEYDCDKKLNSDIDILKMFNVPPIEFI